MLFNSLHFIFFFLPITVAGYYLIGSYFGKKYSIIWLIVCSFFFYAWWSVPYALLLLASIVFNGMLGCWLNGPRDKRVDVKYWLAFGVTANLMLIAFFKYAPFVAENVNVLAGTEYSFENLILPIAISFFTFQQIAFLVDSYRRQTEDFSPYTYTLFIVFFPQLIAGPIVHHKDVIPQFQGAGKVTFNLRQLNVGFSIFSIGLFKKICIADICARWADPVFIFSEAGNNPSFAEAWIGALSYSFQLYFDFSGYSDMAIGLALMLGFWLPINFNSPYKAANIIDFWRRWHITLSRFLRDYLYIPMGGNRLNTFARYAAILIVMLIGGLWHGAAWTFVIWGGIHGLLIIGNYCWHTFKARTFGIPEKPHLLGKVFSVAITFMCVSAAWVVFRAESFDSALRILGSMFGLNGISLGEKLGKRMAHYSDDLNAAGIKFDGLFPNNILADVDFMGIWLLLALLVIFALPNVYQLFRGELRQNDSFAEPRDAIGSNIIWRPKLIWALVAGIMFAISATRLADPSPFLYFQF